MLKIIQDYKELVNANRDFRTAKKELEEYSNHPCFDAIYKLSHHDLYTSEGAYSLGKDKLTCKNVQKYFGQDVAKCEQCSFFGEFGTHKAKEDNFKQAAQKRKEAFNKFIENFCFSRTK